MVFNKDRFLIGQLTKIEVNKMDIFRYRSDLRDDFEGMTDAQRQTELARLLNYRNEINSKNPVIGRGMEDIDDNCLIIIKNRNLAEANQRIHILKYLVNNPIKYYDGAPDVNSYLDSPLLVG